MDNTQANSEVQTTYVQDSSQYPGTKKVAYSDETKEKDNSGDTNEIEIEIDIDLQSMNDKQQIAALKAKVIELKSTIVRNGIDIQEPNTDRLVVTHLINKDTVISKLTLSHETMLKQNNIRRIIDKHQETINEWLADNAIISEMCNSKSLVSYAVVIGDSEKPNIQRNLSTEDALAAHDHGSGSSDACVKLLEQHSRCHDLISKQYERMKLVPCNVGEVFGQKREIIRLLKDYESARIIETKNITEICVQFENVHEKTVELKAILDKALADYDAQVIAENKSNTEQWKITSTITTIEMEMKAFDHFIIPCARVMRQYQLFQRLTLSNTTYLTKRLISEWDILEKYWYTWNVTDFIHWIRYKLEWFNAEIAEKYIVDVKLIENQLRNRMYIDFDNDGYLDLNLHIMTMNDLLIFFNLGAENHDLLRNINDLESYIKVLVIKYPHDFGDRKPDTQMVTFKVPERFQCALTHTIMTEPVFVFDGYTYERSAILAYLKEHHRSPITDDVFVDRVQFLEMEKTFAGDSDDEDCMSDDEEQLLREAEDKRYLLYIDTKLKEEIELFNAGKGCSSSGLSGGGRKYSSAVVVGGGGGIVAIGGSISSGSAAGGSFESRQNGSYTSSSTNINGSSTVTTVTVTEKTVLTERIDVAQ